MQISEEVVAAGARLFACEGIPLQSLSGGAGADGVVFAGHQDGQPFVLKFMPSAPDRRAVIEERIAFVNYLHAGGVNVPRQLPSVHGRCVEFLQGAEGSFVVLKAERLAGQPPGYDPAQWDEGFYCALGRMIGQMHALTRTYSGGAHIGDWEAEHAFFANWCQDEAVRGRWLELGEILRGLPRDRDSFGLVHNDPHPWNFLVSDGQLAALDFDVCAHHWFIMDAAIALFQPMWAQRFRSPARRRALAARLSKDFWAGYDEANHLAPAWLERLPLFMRYRRILFYIAIAQDAHLDPWSQKQIPVLRRAILKDERLSGYED